MGGLLVSVAQAQAEAPAAPQGWSGIPGGDLVLSAILVVLAAGAGWVGFRMVFAVVARWARFTKSTHDDLIVERVHGPFQVLVPLAAVGMVLPALPLGENVQAVVGRVHSAVLTVGFAWLCFVAISIVEKIILDRYAAEDLSALGQRTIHTQARVFRNVTRFLVALLAGSVILMIIPQVRQLGVSLLASAGVAGLVLGVAAQKSLGALIAGIQIALTQPMRIGDVVLVENQYGWIEELTLTYVVVRVWDRRRIVVPITWFIDNPFQNWTRTAGDFLATVYVHADYSVPMAPLRAAIGEHLKTNTLWDRRHWRLEVVDTTEHTVRLRVSVSVSDPSVTWQLGCDMTEFVVTWLQQHHPESLPRLRTALDGEVGGVNGLGPA